MQMKMSHKKPQTKNEANKNNEVLQEAQWKACSLESIVYDVIILTVATIILCVLFFLCRIAAAVENKERMKVSSEKQKSQNDDGMSDENDRIIRCVTWTFMNAIFFIAYFTHSTMMFCRLVLFFTIHIMWLGLYSLLSFPLKSLFISDKHLNAVRLKSDSVLYG